MLVSAPAGTSMSSAGSWVASDGPWTCVHTASPDPSRTETTPSGEISMTCASAGDAAKPAAKITETITARRAPTELPPHRGCRSPRKDKNPHPRGYLLFFARARPWREMDKEVLTVDAPASEMNRWADTMRRLAAPCTAARSIKLFVKTLLGFDNMSIFQLVTADKFIVNEDRPWAGVEGGEQSASVQ
jgi:hypothetical protein